jgi:DNA-directed RNA polymerase specialized sigma24 family protein
VALSAFDSFCRAAEQGRFPRVSDRDDLWQVLVMLTARKAITAVKREHAAKRGGGAVGPLTEADIVANEPTPAFAAEVADECRALLDCLDDELRQIALLKLQGYTNLEIAERLKKSLAAVERKLGIIRSQWKAGR